MCVPHVLMMRMSKGGEGELRGWRGEDSYCLCHLVIRSTAAWAVQLYGTTACCLVPTARVPVRILEGGGSYSRAIGGMTVASGIARDAGSRCCRVERSADRHHNILLLSSAPPPQLTHFPYPHQHLRQPSTHTLPTQDRTCPWSCPLDRLAPGGAYCTRPSRRRGSGACSGGSTIRAVRARCSNRHCARAPAVTFRLGFLIRVSYGLLIGVCALDRD